MPTLAELESTIDTLTTTVGSVQTDIAAVLVILTDAQAGGATIPQDAIDKLNALNTSLSAADASLKSAETPTS